MSNTDKRPDDHPYNGPEGIFAGYGDYDEPYAPEERCRPCGSTNLAVDGLGIKYCCACGRDVNHQ